MLNMAFRTVRTRWPLFLGTFIALTFGIAVMAGMFNVMISANQKRPLDNSPARYDATTIVIEADQVVRTMQTDGTEQTVTLQNRKLLPAKTAEIAADIPGIAQTVIDYSFNAVIIDKPGAQNPSNRQTGHGWSSAQLTPFHLTAGHAPEAGQVAITKAVAHDAAIAINDRVTVVTPVGPRQFIVSGIVSITHANALPGEDTLFFNDVQAANLSGNPNEVDAIGIIATPGADIGGLQRRLQDALSTTAFKAQTGKDKGGNIAAVLYDTAIQPAIEVTGFNISMAGFICIFVVAATASFSIAQRRQEIALLRLVGATPKQVRRMIMSETLLVACAAAVAGSLLGVLFGSLIAAVLRHYGMAPADFTASGTVLGTLAASVIGTLVALAGVFLASKRAGKVRAAEALRDAVAEQRVMTVGRWIIGVVFLLLGGALIFFMMTLGSFAAIAIAVLLTEVFAVALALLMPAFIKPIVSLIALPIVNKTTAVGVLARANLRGAARYTASTAAPILVAVSITISLVGASVLASDTDRVNIEQRVQATHIITGQNNGVPETTIESIRHVPGVLSVVATPTLPFYMAGDLSSKGTFGIMSAAMPKVFDITIMDGSLDDLPSNGVIVTTLKAQELGWKIGEEIPIYLGDGTKTTVRIAAIVNIPIAVPEILVSPSLIKGHIVNLMPTEVFVKVNDTVDTDATQKELRRIATDIGAQSQDKKAWLAATKLQGQRESQVGMTMLLGLALAYLAIAIANTLLMAVSARAKDMVLLRNTGASDRQILSMVAWEAVIVVITASLLGILTASVAVFGVYKILHELVPGIQPPWIQPAYVAVIGASLTVSVLASVLPALLILRRHNRSSNLDWKTVTKYIRIIR